MTNETTTTLASLSTQLADAAANAQASIVRVDDGTRMTASGTIWQSDSKAAFIIATSHGVERDDEITVETHDGTRYPATVVARDGDTDIALLKVAAGNLTAAATAVDKTIRVGVLALALARPGDMGLTATLGVISARRDTQTDGINEYIVQTDAVIYPGFSGGALVDIHGHFIGLLNRMYGRGASVALGAPLVARVAEELMERGNVRRGYLGLRMQLVSLPENIKQSTSQDRGLLVIQVEAQSPAEQHGLLLGDTLLTANGRPLSDVDGLRPHLRAGETITLSVLRGGEVREMTAVVGEQSSNK